MSDNGEPIFDLKRGRIELTPWQIIRSAIALLIAGGSASGLIIELHSLSDESKTQTASINTLTGEVHDQTTQYKALYRNVSRLCAYVDHKVCDSE